MLEQPDADRLRTPKGHRASPETEFACFAQNGAEAEGWYWAFRSSDLKRGRAKALRLLGHSLVVFRGRNSGRAKALEAHCPHMGAHLAEGKVQGDALQCLFHGWRFEADGRCSSSSLDPGRKAPCLAAYPCVEEAGLVWIWMGASTPGPLPHAFELRGKKLAYGYGNRFHKPCSPQVVMVNAIDENHFNTVHPMVRRLTGGLRFAVSEMHPAGIRFANEREPSMGGLPGALLRRLYRGALTYDMSYWYGSNGTVTLGPDCIHFHVLFALRPDGKGGSEGQTVFLDLHPTSIPRRIWLRGKFALAHLLVGYFALGDTEIFRSIRFRLTTPTSADHSILRFHEHYERMPRAPQPRKGAE